MATLPLRQIEGKYEILEKIKEGGMGAIYKVRHRLLEEIRVIKVIRPQIADSKDLQRRFAREAKAAIRLKHPNIAQLYDFAIEPDGVAYMVIEFIDGVTLQEMLARSGPAPLDLTLEIARQSLEALRYLHLNGYVHRDVAPDNLMLSKDFDGRPLVKLIDMGIVKHLEGGGEGLTATGMFLGKVRYSSPEQFSGEKAALDSRSDLYSFGVMLYELLTGKCPILGDSLSQLVAAHLFQAPLSFEQTDPKGRVPDDVREVVLRSLAKKPEDRIATAQEFQELLARRPLSDTLHEDLEKTLAVTIDLRAQDEARAQPGTTQDRLDAQFGLVRTPGPSGALRAADQVAPGTDAEQIATLLKSAGDLVNDRSWEEARRCLYRALAVDPNHDGVRQLLSSVERSLEQEIVEAKAKERERVLAEAVASVEELLRSEKIQEAVAALGQARSRFGDEPRFAAVEQRIVETREALAKREREAAVARALGSIEQAIREERVEEGRRALTAAVAVHGPDLRFVALGRSIDQLESDLVERRRNEALAARFAGISELLAKEKVEEAAAALRAASADHGRHSRFVELEAELQALRAVLAERQRQTAIARAAAEVAGRIAAEDADGAATALAAAVTQFGSVAAFAPVEADLGRLRAALAERLRQQELAVRKRRAQDLLGAARERAEKGAWAEAVSRAAEAVALDPGSQDAEWALGDYRAGEARDRAEREHRRKLDEAVKAIEALLEREDADGASRALEQAARDLVGDPRRELLAQRLLRLRGVLEQRRRENELRAAIAAVEKQLAAEAPDAAATELEASIRRFGEEPRLLALRGDIAEVERRIAARARAQALLAVQTSVRSLVAGERIEEARQALGDARMKHGDDAVFAGLDKELAQAVRAAQARARREALTRAAAAVDLEIGRGALERATRLLDDAVREHGADPLLAAAAGRVAAAERRRNADELLRQAASLAGDPAAALAIAQKALEVDPGYERAQAIVEQHRLAVEEAARARRLAELLAAARRELEQGQPEQALARLSAEGAEHTGSAELRELVATVQAEVSRREEERRRADAIASAVASADDAIEKGKLDRAEKLVKKAIGELGSAPPLLALAGRIDSLRVAEKRREVAEIVARARQRVAAGNERKARALCEQALELDADAPEVKALLAELDAARARAVAPTPAAVVATPSAPARDDAVWWRSRPAIALAIGLAALAALVTVGLVVWRSGPESPIESETALTDPAAQIAETSPVGSPPVAAPVDRSFEAAAPPVRDVVPAPPALDTALAPDPAPPASERVPAGAEAGAALEEARARTQQPSAPAVDSAPATREDAAPPPPSRAGGDESATRRAERPVAVPIPLEPVSPTRPEERVEAAKPTPAGARADTAEAAPPGAPATEPSTGVARPPVSKPAANAAPTPAPSRPRAPRPLPPPAEPAGEAVMPPVLKAIPPPRLPALAERQRREAVILVRVLVDEQGKVLEAEVQDNDPQHRIYFQEALRVAKMASFTPATRNGVASRMFLTIPVQFRLR
jgi:TonB family protein